VSQRKQSRSSPQPPGNLPLPDANCLSSKKSVYSFSLIAVAALLVYSNTFQVPFVLDDFESIRDNPLIRNPADFIQLFLLYKTRFIGYFSFSINYWIGQNSVTGYHVFNLILHAANGCLVFWLTRLLLPSAKTKTALIAGLLFILHPIQTQAVTYIVQRLASLATFFYLASLCCYFKTFSLASAKAQRLFFLFAFISAVLGMFTKEITFTLPFTLILLEVLVLRHKAKDVFSRALPFLALLPLIPALYLWNTVPIAGGVTLGDSRSISSLHYLLTQFNVICTYLRLLVFPINQRLEYDYPLSTHLNASTLLSAGLILTLLILLWRLIKKDRGLAFCGFFFFIALSVESSIIPIQDVIFEHRLYLPMAAFAVFMSIGMTEYFIPRLAPGKSKIADFLIILVLVILGGMTFHRNQIWNNDFSIWYDTVSKSPGNYRAHNNLGNAYKRRNLLDSAITEYQKSLRIFPQYSNALGNLGDVYFQLNKLDSAIYYLTRSLEYDCRAVAKVKKELGEAYFNRGLLRHQAAKFDSAMSDYRAALRFRPDFAKAQCNLGLLLMKKRLDKEAEAEYLKILAYAPDFAMAYYNLGTLYSDRGDLKKACGYYRQSIQSDPGYTWAYLDLALAYEKLGQKMDAIKTYERVLQTEANPEAEKALGRLKRR